MIRWLLIGMLAMSLHFEVAQGWSVAGCFLRGLYGVEGGCH